MAIADTVQMTEYSVAFAKELVSAARKLQLDETSSLDRQRAVLYLSLLSCEISLKALLEAAGLPLSKIKKLSHNLSALLGAVGSCKVNINARCVPATQIRAIIIDTQLPKDTVGKLLDAEQNGASKYPNQIRYGELLRHFPAAIMLTCAENVVTWAERNLSAIKK